MSLRAQYRLNTTAYLKQATKSGRSVRSARKRTGHVFEKIHLVASGSSTINHERPGKIPRTLLAMARSRYPMFWTRQLPTQ